MNYRSTAGRAPEVSFREALFRGLAPDGGLYVPAALPALPAAHWHELGGAAPPEVAAALLGPFVGDDIAPDDLARLCAAALDFPLPLVALDDTTTVLELFHGPTLAFKDVGARFMALCMAQLGDAGPRRGTDPGGALTILVATSGDTGGAVAHAFHGVPETEVVILYPRGQVSPLQEKQLTTLGGNVRAFAVAGSFDDCQRLVKAAFVDPDLRRTRRLTSANSINVGRLLPQMVSFAVAGLAGTAATRSRSAVPAAPRVVVPSGNFGNLAAGLLARRLGAPLGPLVAATNANAVVPEFLAGADYRPRPSRRTLSNAMDVGDPSNWARIVDLFGESAGGAATRAALAATIAAHGVDDEATGAGIVDAERRTGYVFDPHGAVGWVTLARERARLPPAEAQRPAVVLATAHPAKFKEIVEPLLGRRLQVPARLAELLDRPALGIELAADLGALRQALLR